jgi:hypothetical protein
MIDATIRQNKAYTVILPTILSTTYRRITRRFWGVNLRISGGDSPVSFAYVPIEKSIPPSLR